MTGVSELIGTCLSKLDEYPSYFKLQGCWLPSLLGLASARPLQTAFKLVPDRFVTHLPPSCNSNYLGSRIFTVLAVFTALKVLC
ncbi:hypothetical protein A6J66_012250 [Yersinia enterocolitica]|nr:hypothetical protein A6J66_012250 [Yersinia enterocolitica]